MEKVATRACLDYVTPLVAGKQAGRLRKAVTLGVVVKGGWEVWAVVFFSLPWNGPDGSEVESHHAHSRHVNLPLARPQRQNKERTEAHFRRAAG